MLSSAQEDHSCCSNERKRLIRELRSCEYCSTSYDEIKFQHDKE